MAALKSSGVLGPAPKQHLMILNEPCIDAAPEQRQTDLRLRELASVKVLLHDINKSNQRDQVTIVESGCMCSVLWKGACRLVLCMRECFGFDDTDRHEDDRLAVMDVLLHKALSPPRTTLSPPGESGGVSEQTRETKENSR